MITQLISQQRTFLSLAHKQEWLSSGVSQDIINLNIQSLIKPDQIAYQLNRSTYTGTNGWLALGEDPTTGLKLDRGSFKPDIAPIGKDGKAKKYLNPTNLPAPITFLSVPDRGYWQKVLGNIEIPILVTEGVKKSGATLSQDSACISISGVNCWSTKDSNGNLSLRDELLLFANPGRKIILAFDSDWHTNKLVLKALIDLAKAFQDKGCLVSVALWESSLGKGLDDFIVNTSKQDFLTMVKNAPEFSDFIKSIEKQFAIPQPTKSSYVGSKNPDHIGEMLSNHFKDQIVYDADIHSWRIYEYEHLGCWDIADEIFIKRSMQQHLKSFDLHGYTDGYSNSVLAQMKVNLAVKKFSEKPILTYCLLKMGFLILKLVSFYLIVQTTF